MKNTMHLSEEQLDDLLIGDASAEVSAHVAGCEACQTRVREAEAPFASFRDVSLAWAERRSATMPASAAILARPRTSHRFGWAMAATAALAVGVAIPVMRDRMTPAPVAQPETMAAISHTGMANVTPVAATSEQIDNDNRMLQDIDRALGSQDATLASYAMEPQSERTRASHKNLVRD
ncbi:hypothetical protein ACFQBQ_14780 [Granulicella cerasi]|uniref:Zinc-finger domain-containing protein n=1 Tax=Granulicella cerasi TaxID=741063 RepID=A0ABW1ZDN7_9BACT|nr:hypothetical protein [Granulicella cerasi]